MKLPRHVLSASRLSVFFLPALLFSSPSLHAQEELIAFEHYNYKNGLTAAVTQIVQDHDGFLWLASTDGLFRFDGKNFTVHRNIPGDTSSIPNNIINDLFTDHSGRVWIATNGGLCRYDYTDDMFHPVQYNDTLEKIDRHRVYAVAEIQDGMIWIATRTILHLLKDNREIKTVPLPAGENMVIRSIHADKKNRLWIGSNRGLLVYLPETGKFIISDVHSSFSREKKLTVTVHPIVDWHGDTMLLGSWYGGLQQLYLSGDSIVLREFTDTVETDARKHIVKGVSRTASGTWWIGTYGNGLAWFDEKSKSFTHHFHHDPSNEKSPGDDYINDIFTDKTGIVWIGTAAGLDKFDPLTQQFRTVKVSVPEGLVAIYRVPGSIAEDKRDKNMLWVTVSGSGLYHFNRLTHEMKCYQHNEKDLSSLPDNSIYTTYTDRKGRMWVGTAAGVFQFDPETGKFSKPHIPSGELPKSVHHVLQDDKDRFWFASFSQGICCYDENLQQVTYWQYEENKKNCLPDNRVFSITMDHTGKIWTGTQNRGLCRLDPETGTFIYFMHDKKNPATIPDNGIYDLLALKNGHLWIATENGLADMNLADFSIRTYTTADGLCNNDVFSVTMDHRHHLWLGTNNGFSDLDTAKKFFKNYFISDGLPENHVAGGICCTSDGSLYFGTAEMITWCRPEEMKINKTKPPVVITDFRVFDRKVNVLREGKQLLPIHLTYRQNMITFDFAALNFTNTLLNQYAYMLEGFDREWIRCGTRQSATYTNLDGGSYTFRVKAANNDGIWNEEGASVMLTVAPPFWNTWWFYLLITMSVAGILYAVYHIRVRQLLRLQQIRLRISRDLHDDIGSTLSSINMISSMANKKAGDVKRSAELFDTISAASRQAMDLMNDIVWSINPKNDRMEMILIRMRQYASEILEAAQIAFTIEMNESAGRITLPVDKRKDFYLVFKEAINNLAKYSGASRADIRLHYNDQDLTMTISDDGIGFDPVSPHGNRSGSGNGLKNMKARAMQMDGSLEIISSPGAGSTIKLKIHASP